MPVSSDDRAPSGPVEAASRRLDVEAASRRFGNAARVPIHIAMLKSVGSLWLTVALLVLLIGILLFGTVIEKYYGATAAKFGVYGAWWFNLLGLILGLNSAAALALRWPWKRQHLGFVLPHVGLIVLLIGCFVSRRYGVEATVSVLEGQESNRAYQGVRQHVELDGGQRFKLRIEPAAGTNAKDVPKETVIDVPFTSGPFNWQVYSELSLFPWGLAHRDRGVLYDRDGIRLEVLDYLSNSEIVDVPALTVETTPLAGDSAAGETKAYRLNIKPDDGSYPLPVPYGLGGEKTTPGGTRILFWMTGSEDETAAFRHSAPQGPLGKLGRVVLYAKGHSYDWPLDDWQTGARRKLGDSGLEAELVGVKPDPRNVNVWVNLRIHKGALTHDLFLSSEYPEISRPDYDDAVFGSYWLERSAKAERPKEAGKAASPKPKLTKESDPLANLPPARPRSTSSRAAI